MKSLKKLADFEIHDCLKYFITSIKFVCKQLKAFSNMFILSSVLKFMLKFIKNLY